MTQLMTTEVLPTACKSFDISDLYISKEQPETNIGRGIFVLAYYMKYTKTAKQSR